MGAKRRIGNGTWLLLVSAVFVFAFVTYSYNSLRKATELNPNDAFAKRMLEIVRRRSRNPEQ